MNNPQILLRAGGVTLALASATVVVPAVGIASLGALGFTTAGVAAGSIAAGVQSMVYGAYTCGVFSALQAAGAAAVMPGAGALVAGSAGVVAGVGAALS